MTVAAISKISGEPLADKLERRETFPASQALDVLRQLAQSVAEQHESGRLHLHIAPDTVLFDGASGQAVLREPLDKGRSFGGADGDDESCPPELQQAQVVYVPVDLTAAREVLRAAGLSAVDPRRVDLYQLGVLLCRMLTG